MPSVRMSLFAGLIIGIAVSFWQLAAAQDPQRAVVVNTGQPFAPFAEKLRSAAIGNGMGIVAEACAHCGAKAVLDMEIPGNRVVMIFHPRYAVRLLEANVDAGIEAPLRLYLTERPDGTARLSYERPSRTFAGYGGKGLAELAAELDDVVDRIVRQAQRD